MLPDSAREKPIAGRIVRVGPGKREKDGSRKAPKLKEGDAVLLLQVGRRSDGEPLLARSLWWCTRAMCCARPRPALHAAVNATPCLESVRDTKLCKARYVKSKTWHSAMGKPRLSSLSLS